MLSCIGAHTYTYMSRREPWDISEGRSLWANSKILTLQCSEISTLTTAESNREMSCPKSNCSSRQDLFLPHWGEPHSSEGVNSKFTPSGYSDSAPPFPCFSQAYQWVPLKHVSREWSYPLLLQTVLIYFYIFNEDTLVIKATINL